MRRWLLGGMALLGLGCSGPDVSKFEGRWTAIRGAGESSCGGTWAMSEMSDSILLREGDDSDLEWLGLDEDGQPVEDCIYRYSVEGDVATLDGRQSCVTTFKDVDPDTGAIVELTLRSTVTRDSLHIVDGGMYEEGDAVTDIVFSDGTRQICEEAFHIEWKRP